MAQFKLSKKQAHVFFFILFDIPCMLGFWYFYNEIRHIFLDVINRADLVNVGSKDGFFILNIVAPAGHLIGIVEHFNSEFIKKHTRSISYGFIAMLIFLFISAFSISALTKAKVENAGYMNCKPLEWRGTYSKSYTYTRDQAVCDQLVAEKAREK